MNRRKVERLKFISFLCITILIGELFYVGYHLLYRGETSVYFEGINAITLRDQELIAVGSNNDNDNNIMSNEKNTLKNFIMSDTTVLSLEQLVMEILLLLLVVTKKMKKNMTTLFVMR